MAFGARLRETGFGYSPILKPVSPRSLRMTPLRQRMIDDMQLRNLAAHLRRHRGVTGTEPIKDRGSRQGLVHRAVSSLSRPPVHRPLSSFFGRETEETFNSHTPLSTFFSPLFQSFPGLNIGILPAPMLYLELESVPMHTSPKPRGPPGPSGFDAFLRIAQRGTPFTAVGGRALMLLPAPSLRRYPT